MQSGTSQTFNAMLQKSRRRKTELAERSVVEDALKEELAGIWLKDSSVTDLPYIRSFLTSPDAEVIVRRIFANLVAGDKEYDLAIEAELVSFLSYHSQNNNDTDLNAKHVYDLLRKCCVTALRRFMRATGSLTVNAQDILSSIAFRRIEAQIESLRLVRENGFAPIFDRSAFNSIESKYRVQMRGAHGVIVPQSIQRIEKVPIDELYVPSDLVTSGKKHNYRVDIGLLLRSGFRTVVLGTPGGGKSTLSDKVCYELAENLNSSGQQMVPFHVVLRDFASDVNCDSISFIDFLSQQSRALYQTIAPAEFFESALLAGRAFIAFDGLDELLDTADRSAITRRIEAFARAYPSCPILVTSREVGYDEAPLDTSLFETYRLAQFSEDQTKDYCRKWFARIENMSHADRTSKIDSFMSESEVTPDLRANPLMLSLMCTLYNEEGYIPRNRPDVYEKCANLLFEKWDRRRNIIVNLPFEAQVDPAMKFLAYWIYTNQEVQKGVSESQIISKVSEYLRLRLYDDDDEAKRAAQSFTEFCRGRAWVFSDVGTTPAGARLYNFTHRTFLEYFAACHLVRTHSSADTLSGVIIPRIQKGQWEVVSELSVQILNKQVEGAVDELFGTMVEQLDQQPLSAQQNIFDFILRCMRVVTATPSVTRATVAALLTWAAKPKSTGKPDWNFSGSRGPWESGSPLAYCLSSFVGTTKESRAQVQKGLGLFCGSLLESDASGNHLLVAELYYHLQRERLGAAAGRESSNAWRLWATDEIEKRRSDLLVLWEKNANLASMLFFLGILPSNAIIERYGLSVLFSQRPSRLAENVSYGPPVYQIAAFAVGAVWTQCYVGLQKDFVSVLSYIYLKMMEGDDIPQLVPIFRIRNAENLLGNSNDSVTKRAWETCVSQDAVAGLCMVLCPVERRPKNAAERLKMPEGSQVYLDPLRSLISFELGDLGDLRSLFSQCGLDEPHVSTLLASLDRREQKRRKS